MPSSSIAVCSAKAGLLPTPCLGHFLKNLSILFAYSSLSCKYPMCLSHLFLTCPKNHNPCFSNTYDDFLLPRIFSSSVKPVSDCSTEPFFIPSVGINTLYKYDSAIMIQSLHNPHQDLSGYLTCHQTIFSKMYSAFVETSYDFVNYIHTDVLLAQAGSQSQ